MTKPKALLTATSLLLLLGCTHNKPRGVEFPAPPPCVKVKCVGTWMVQPNKGLRCDGHMVADLICYEAKPSHHATGLSGNDGGAGESFYAHALEINNLGLNALVRRKLCCCNRTRQTKPWNALYVYMPASEFRTERKPDHSHIRTGLHVVMCSEWHKREGLAVNLEQADVLDRKFNLLPRVGGQDVCCQCGRTVGEMHPNGWNIVTACVSQDVRSSQYPPIFRH